jgi:protein-tyrosine-phosphatase
VDLTAHRSRALTHDVVDDTDLFVVPAIEQRRQLRREQGIDPDRVLHLGDLDPEPIRARKIEDPWGKERTIFRQSYDRIDRCLDVLADALEKASPTPPR